MARMTTGFAGTAAVNTNPNTNWSTVNNNEPNWGTGAPATAMVWDTSVKVGSGTTDLYGSTPTVVGDLGEIDVKGIIQLCRQAIKLYDTNVHDKKVVATEVDVLRSKIKNKTFDPYASEELKNIFGFILGDVVSELYQNRGNEYDEILDLIFANFPEGTGNPVKSKYGAGSKYGNATPYAKVISDIKKYINKNGLKFPNTVNRFMKIWDNFKANKPEYDNIDIQDLFNNFIK